MKANDIMPDLTDNNAIDLGDILSRRMEENDSSGDCVVYDLAKARELLNLTCVTEHYEPGRVTALETDLSGLTFRFSGASSFLMPVMSGTLRIRFDNTTWMSSQDHSWYYIPHSYLPQSSWMNVEFDSAFFFSDSVLDGSQWKIIANSSMTPVEWQGCSFAESVFYGMQTRANPQETDAYEMFRMDGVSGSITLTGNYINTPVVITAITGASLQIKEAAIDYLYVSNAQLGRIAVDNSVIASFHLSYNGKGADEFLVNQSVLTCDPFEFSHLWMTGGAQWSFNGVQLNQCRNLVIDSVRHVNWINSTLVDSQIEFRGHVNTLGFENTHFINTGRLFANLSMPMLTGVQSNRMDLVNSRFSCHASSDTHDNCVVPMISNIATSQLRINGLTFDNIMIENWNQHSGQKKSSAQIEAVVVTGNEVTLKDVQWACDETKELCLPNGLVLDNNTRLTILCSSTNNTAHRFFRPVSTLLSTMGVGMSAYPFCDSQDSAPSLLEYEYDKNALILLLVIATGLLGTLGYLIYESISHESPQDNKREDYAFL